MSKRYRKIIRKHRKRCLGRRPELRTAFLQGRDGFEPTASGGDRRGERPSEAKAFLEDFLPLQDSPNYQLVADELERLCGLVRARSSVEGQGPRCAPRVLSGPHSDPVSEFQRAFRGLGVAHRVAPTPQAQGKIERRFDTFQKRLVTFLAHARVTSWQKEV